MEPLRELHLKIKYSERFGMAMGLIRMISLIIALIFLLILLLAAGRILIPPALSRRHSLAMATLREVMYLMRFNTMAICAL